MCVCYNLDNKFYFPKAYVLKSWSAVGRLLREGYDSIHELIHRCSQCERWDLLGSHWGRAFGGWSVPSCCLFHQRLLDTMKRAALAQSCSQQGPEIAGCVPHGLKTPARSPKKSFHFPVVSLKYLSHQKKQNQNQNPNKHNIYEKTILDITL